MPFDSERVTEPGALTREMRLARALAGAGFLGVALRAWRISSLRSLGAVAGWFGISHLVAASTGFSGCPELGAIPNLLVERDVYTVCGPWDRIDTYLGK